MSLNSALDTAVIALQAQSFQIANISQNLSNTGTTAYKTQDTTFESLITGTGASASGGVTYTSSRNLDSQGNISSSPVGTNVALQGRGFFVVNASTTGVSTSDQFTRDGSFAQDQNGNLVNSQGFYLKGWATDGTGTPTATSTNDLSSLTNVSVSSIKGSAKATDTITTSINLPANATGGETFTNSYQLYDSLGVSNTMTATWRKSNTAVNTWTLALTNPYLTTDTSSTPTSTGTLSPTSLAGTSSVATVATTTGSPTVAATHTVVVSRIATAGSVVGVAVSPYVPVAVASGLDVTIAGTTYTTANIGGVGTTEAAALALINTAIAGHGTATLSNGVLTITAANAGDTVAVADHVALSGVAASLGLAVGSTVNAPLTAQYTVDGGGVLSSVTNTVSGASAIIPGLSTTFVGTGTTSIASGNISFTITFNGDGSLASIIPLSTQLSITGWTSGATNSSIDLSLGTLGGTDGLTQFASADNNPALGINTIDQNGLALGKLSSVTIAGTGIVTANFDNGLKRPVFKIPVATFPDDSNLTQSQGSIYSSNISAGVLTLQPSGSGSAGTIQASSLEGSTADASGQLNEMIAAEQAYKASAEIISTVKSLNTSLLQAVQ